jgi:hypothetical protein
VFIREKYYLIHQASFKKKTLLTNDKNFFGGTVQQAQFVFFSFESVLFKDAPFALLSLLLALNMYLCHSMLK